MIKVLIVDDERLIRIAMRNIVDWEGLGCKVIGYEKDGIEALKKLENEYADLIITDLKMPNLDGISFIKEIKKRKILSKIVVLSNHGDYELVRMAMKEGAFDYLLKVTIERKDIEDIVKQVKDDKCNLNKEVKEIENKEIEVFDTEEFKNNLNFIKKYNEIEDNEFIKSIRNAGISNILEDNYKISYFNVDNIRKIYNSKIKEKSNLKINIRNIIEESISKDLNYKIIFINNHSGIIIFYNLKEDSLIQINNYISKNINQYLNITITIVLSKCYKGLKNFKKCFKETINLFELSFYLGENSLIDCEKANDFKEIDYTAITYPMEIIKNIRERNFKKNYELCKKILKYSIENNCNPNDIKEIFKFIFSNIEGYEIQKGIKKADKFNEIRKEIDKCKYISSLEEYLYKEFIDIESWIKENNKTYRREIEIIVDYIDKNIDKKISLTMLAKKVNMNESYLSRIFKNETGKNITYFINERKMNKALELLSKKDIMVKQASLMVGIDDQFYFNKLFKKFYGINPSEFKKKCFV
ncbi:response regulator [Clostridium sp. Ade.TY]|uniref:response regulator transcription factor n=1 Tax=Clostridium sp. Ade.TY TaxID=1391647 RepID=UPI000403CC00|nr:response regulator [Clostridium sp. Ade.TY]